MMKRTLKAAAGLLTSLIAMVAIGGCGSATTTGSATAVGGAATQTAAKVTGTPIAGGTVYYAQQPDSSPNYIFPLVSGAYYSAANTAQFQTLMYRPLYWYGDQNKALVDYDRSIGDAPIYSDGDRVVTISLKDTHFSDGERVSARDVGFWINLVKANRDEWASYVPGGFPDNIERWQALNQSTIRLTLARAYNPAWFTNNELSQITPLPLAWDRTSLSAKAPAPTAPTDSALPDSTPAGARRVYAFLNAQSKQLASYATSPLWQVVDGAFKLVSLSSDGEARFVPNPRYDGPDKPRIAAFVELPYTSEQSELAVLRSGSGRAATTGAGSAGTQITVGYVPDPDLPLAGTLKAQGYNLLASYTQGFDYFEPNFNNPSAGPIFRQLYFRQAFQHLVNQRGWIKAYYDRLGVPTYSPVPAQPANPYSNALANVDPYPFDLATAKRILAAHGWRVAPGGVTTCAKPGTAHSECGAGIAKGKALRFTLTYPDGLSYTDYSMQDLQADARQVGIVITLREVSTATVDAEIEPCTAGQAACSWQLGQYGEPWYFTPDHYPSGEEIFQTGAQGNVGNFSDPQIDRLIVASTTAPAADAQRTLDAYANAVRTALPDFWQPSPGTLITLAENLAGYVPNAYGYISPEQWYFVK